MFMMLCTCHLVLTDMFQRYDYTDLFTTKDCKLTKSMIRINHTIAFRS